jgi:hypothetical protein
MTMTLNKTLKFIITKQGADTFSCFAPFIITKQFKIHIFMLFFCQSQKVRNFKRFAFFKNTKDTKKKFVPQFLFPKDICAQDTKNKKQKKKKMFFLEGNNKVLITNEPLSSRCCSPF